MAAKFLMLGLIVGLTPISSVFAADTIVEMSAYAAGCPGVDKTGGPDESKWSDLPPSLFTLNEHPKQTMIAVSKFNGTNHLKGGCYTASEGEPDEGPGADLLAAIQDPNRIFFAADECPACSNLDRVDVSLSCDTQDFSNFKVRNVRLTQVACPAAIERSLGIHKPINPQISTLEHERAFN